MMRLYSKGASIGLAMKACKGIIASSGHPLWYDEKVKKEPGRYSRYQGRGVIRQVSILN
jgi:hypothetical protein